MLEITRIRSGAIAEFAAHGWLSWCQVRPSFLTASFSMSLISIERATKVNSLNVCRGLQDELYVRTVLSTAAKESQQAKRGSRGTPKLCIMDARAYTAAVANGYVGGGRENPGERVQQSKGFINMLAVPSQEILIFIFCSVRNPFQTTIQTLLYRFCHLATSTPSRPRTRRY